MALEAQPLLRERTCGLDAEMLSHMHIACKVPGLSMHWPWRAGTCAEDRRDHDAHDGR